MLVALALVIPAIGSGPGGAAAADVDASRGTTTSVRTAPELRISAPDTARVGERMEYSVYFNPSPEDPNPRISVDSNVADCRREPFTPPVISVFAGIDCVRRAVDTDVPGFTAWFTVTFEDGSTSSASFTTTVSRRQQPDGMVRRGERRFIGQDVYSRKATQVATGTLRRGQAITFTFRVQNDGPLRDRFHINAEPYSSVGNERWRFGGKDVTEEIATTFVYTRWLEPGEHDEITLTLTRWRWADLGDTDVQRVLFESDLDPTRKDKVAIRVTITDKRR
jgi:hypothetical protein